MKTQVDQANLHVALLKAQVDATRAQLALAKNDTAGAQVALSKTPQTVNTIKTLLPANQQGVVDSLQQRLKLAVSEIKDNAYAAQSDLDVFSAGLTQLEATLFAR